jgi:hypothetical protein
VVRCSRVVLCRIGHTRVGHLNEACACFNSSQILLKSAVQDSVGDSDDLVYARRPSLIMLLPEILSDGRWDWDRQILPAYCCSCSGIFRASIQWPVGCGWRDDGSGLGRTGLDPSKLQVEDPSRVVVIQMAWAPSKLFWFGFRLCLFFWILEKKYHGLVKSIDLECYEVFGYNKFYGFEWKP